MSERGRSTWTSVSTGFPLVLLPPPNFSIESPSPRRGGEKVPKADEGVNCDTDVRSTNPLQDLTPAAYNSHLSQHGQKLKHQFGLLQNRRSPGGIARNHRPRRREAAQEPCAWRKDAGERRAAKLHPRPGAGRADQSCQASKEEMRILIERETAHRGGSRCRGKINGS